LSGRKEGVTPRAQSVGLMKTKRNFRLMLTGEEFGQVD